MWGVSQLTFTPMGKSGRRKAGVSCRDDARIVRSMWNLGDRDELSPGTTWVVADLVGDGALLVSSRISDELEACCHVFGKYFEQW
jgi:hypothetical protein